MREILFRGKAINRAEGREYRTNYKNGDWVYGLVTKMFDERYKEFPAEMTNTDGIGGVEVDYRTIGQCTGLTDKNGKKIFEGDIVKTHYANVQKSDFYANAQKSDFIEQVVFHNGKFCAYFSNQLCKQWVNLYDGIKHLPQDKSVYMDSVEVIGNIYDNPELLVCGARMDERTVKNNACTCNASQRSDT